jgi:hypothetical protein
MGFLEPSTGRAETTSKARREPRAIQFNSTRGAIILTYVPHEFTVQESLWKACPHIFPCRRPASGAILQRQQALAGKGRIRFAWRWLRERERERERWGSFGARATAHRGQGDINSCGEEVVTNRVVADEAFRCGRGTGRQLGPHGWPRSLLFFFTSPLRLLALPRHCLPAICS